MRTTDKEPTKFVPSAGKIFADGVAIELIRDSGGALRLLSWDGRTAKTADQVTHGGVTYTTPQIHPSACDSLLLPSGLAKFGSTRQLVNEIAELISRASAGSQSVVVPLSFFVLASWLSDNSPVPPFLWIVVPTSCTTATLKQLLRLLCRHAIVVNFLSASWPNSLPMGLQPTLIGEIDSPSRRLLNTLRASQTHGVYPARAGMAVDPFCAKLIFSREPLADPAAAGFPFEVVLSPKGEYVPPLDAGHAARVAEKFQNQLLAYRFANYSKLAPPSFDLGRVSAPVQALAYSLASPIVGDDELQTQIVPYLVRLDADIQTDNAMTLDAIILEVLVSRWNDREVAATEIAGDTNTIIRGRGGSKAVSPETVGWELKALGLRATTVSGGLRGLKMIEVRPAIAKLAAIYGLKVPENIRAAGRTIPRPHEN
jgi:hypothetical protein